MDLHCDGWRLEEVGEEEEEEEEHTVNTVACYNIGWHTEQVVMVVDTKENYSIGMVDLNC